MNKIFFILLLAVIQCLGEAPYPAAGFRPHKPFDLPHKYLPPMTQQQQVYLQRPEPHIVEINQQRVDYLGSQATTTPIRQPSHMQHPVYYTPQPNVVNIQRSNDFYKIFPSNNLQTKYDERKSSSAMIINGLDDRDKSNTLNILQAALQYYKDNVMTANNEREDNNNDMKNIMEGKYFVLTPDNSITQVSYLTTQDAAEAQTNDFKAQLIYTKIGELNNPLYKYNEKGQLVRLVK